MAMLSDEAELMVCLSSDGSVVATIWLVITTDYTCDDDNMGCSVGTLFESGIADNGESY